MAKCWYALRSKPRKEFTLWRQLSLQNYEVYFPRLRVQPVNPRSRKYQPYFPGYMFVHVDLEESGMSTFQWMPYAMGLVCFGNEPALVPENLIYMVQKKVENIAQAGGELFVDLKKGDKIRITEGLFSGYEGIFDTRLPGNERVRVLIRLLSDQHVGMELRAAYIKKKSHSQR